MKTPQTDAQDSATLACWGFLGVALLAFSKCTMWIRASNPRAPAQELQDRAARVAGCHMRWRALPEDMPKTVEEWTALRVASGECRGGVGLDQVKLPGCGRTKAEPFHALSLDECAAARLGLTRVQRSAHVRRAAERGDVRRLTALLEAGTDLGDVDDYGQTPLFVAAWRGHARVVELLLHWGADPATACNGNILPVAAAASCGHEAVLQLITNARASTFVPSPSPFPWCQQTDGACVRLVHLPIAACCSGRACYIDGAFPEGFLRRLEDLWSVLPHAAKEAEGYPRVTAQARARSLGHGTQRGDRSLKDAAPRRSYYCDAEGWITRELAAGLRRASGISRSMFDGLMPQVEEGGGDAFAPCEVAYAHVRFLHYAEAGGYLAPHIDLSRTDIVTGKRSSHTFLLYLKGASEGLAGGETVLLERVHAESPATATVAPLRGRLLLFPHECPHKAMPVEEPPKLLLRGEMR